jgi:hypothetical protein
MDTTETVTTEELHKEIELIQSCVTRMENNSFLLKGWLITLIIAFITLLPENINRFYICIIILLIDLAFWYLDGFYLKQEKLYRWKYEWVTTKRLEGNRDFLYNLNPYEKDMWIVNNIKGKKEEPNLILVMLTKSLIPIYGGIFLSVIILIIFKYHP